MVSRKRKAWEGLHAGGSKGGPGRREEEEEEEGEKEEEGESLRISSGEEEETPHNWEEEEPDSHHAHLVQPRPSHHHLLSPLNANFVNEEVATIPYKAEDAFYLYVLCRILTLTTWRLTSTVLSPAWEWISTLPTTPCRRPC